MTHGRRTRSIAHGLALGFLFTSLAVGCQNANKIPATTLPTSAKGLPAPNNSPTRAGPLTGPRPASPSPAADADGQPSAFGSSPFTPLNSAPPRPNPAVMTPSATALPGASTVAEPVSKLSPSSGTGYPSLNSKPLPVGLSNPIPPEPPSSTAGTTVTPPSAIHAPAPAMPAAPTSPIIAPGVLPVGQ